MRWAWAGWQETTGSRWSRASGEHWAVVDGSGHQIHGRKPACLQWLSCSAGHHFMVFKKKKTKPGPFLCLFRWNSQLSWEELVLTYFERGLVGTLGVLPSWNTWRKTSGFDPKKALSKKKTLNKHDSGTLISQRLTPCGKKEDWEARWFFKSKNNGAWRWLF